MRGLLAILGLAVVVAACAPHGDEHDNRQDARIAAIEERVRLMENSMQENIAAINDLDVGAGASEQLIADLQDVVNGQQAALVQLETYESIVEFIDPCGDGVGYDEVLLRTKFGKLIVYFEHGNKRFLTLLSPGSYVTTDQQGCRFNVQPDGQVVW